MGEITLPILITAACILGAIASISGIISGIIYNKRNPRYKRYTEIIFQCILLVIFIAGIIFGAVMINLTLSGLL